MSLRLRPLVLYGAGVNAILCYRFLTGNFIEIDAVCVTDTNAMKHTPVFEGQPVATLEEVSQRFGVFDCVIGFSDITAARINLSRMSGIRDVFIIDNPGIVEDIDFSFVQTNRKEFSRVFQMLCDETSQKAFIDFLNLRISGTPVETFSGMTLPYFHDVFSLNDDEALVDCGAYDGDTVISFVEKTRGQYSHIYAFEPDKSNFDKLVKNIKDKHLQNVEVIKKGAWSKKDLLKFSTPVSPASRISENGNIQIEVDSIDNVLKERRVTIIKMDIEGAELQALIGAQNIIARERPKLAISVYHKANDLITIPKYLSNILNGYNFYLRRHSPFSLETVLYAIPSSLQK